MDFALLTAVGRVLLGGAFAFAGIRNAMNVPLLTTMMTARGVPSARAVLYAGIVLQIAAGLAFAAGLHVAYAAALLIVFLVAATPMFHNFWDYQGADRAAKLNGWISNVALAGGLLIAAGG